MTTTQLWNLLRRVQSLSFVARSGAGTGWDGTGVGTVQVGECGQDVLTFTEEGTWRPEAGGRQTTFHNVYRWTLAGDLIRLEHLRFGADNPVYLFDLAQSGEREWRSMSPHLCRDDCYAAVLLAGDDGFTLRWSVRGPRKRETIEYHYQ
jgi:hypothetical protein